MTKNKSILVTGAAGFISSHLIERLLKEGHLVVGLDNFDPFYDIRLKKKNINRLEQLGGSNFTFRECDISDVAAFNDLPKIDLVVHIAAKAGVRPSIDSPGEYVNANIVGTQNVLDWMAQVGCKKLLFASSSSVYGNNKTVPFIESDVVDYPISPYAYSKKANELQIHAFHKLYDIDVVCMRFFTVYGPRQRPDLAIRKFVTKIRNNEPIEMFGDGSTGRDYTYVTDTVDGICKAMDYIVNSNSVYEVLNFGNSNPIKLSEMINVIYDVTGAEKNIIQLPMQPGDVDLTYANIEKSQQLIGYDPKVTFKEGIRLFVEWLKTQED